MEQILLTYSLPKKKPYQLLPLQARVNLGVMAIPKAPALAGVLHGDALAPYLFIICQDCMLWTSSDKIKENGFKFTKERSWKYPAKTNTDADYTDDIALLANTPAKAETLLHSLEQAAAGIGLQVNAHKKDDMSFNQKGNISTLNGSSLKLVDKFNYLRSNVLINRDIHQQATIKGMDSYQ